MSVTRHSSMVCFWISQVCSGDSGSYKEMFLSIQVLLCTASFSVFFIHKEWQWENRSHHTRSCNLLLLKNICKENSFNTFLCITLANQTLIPVPFFTTYIVLSTYHTGLDFFFNLNWSLNMNFNYYKPILRAYEL